MSKRPSIFRTYSSYWRAVVASGLFAMIGAIGESAALVVVASAAPSIGQADPEPVMVALGPIAFEGTTLQMFAIAAVTISIATVARLVSAWIAARASASWTAGRRRSALFGYLNASYAYIARQRAARLHELTGQHARLAGSAVSLLSSTLDSVVSLLVFMASALILDPIATVVFFVLGSASILGLRPLYKWTKAQANLQGEKAIDLGVNVTETAEVIREVKTLGVVKPFQERFGGEVDELARISRRLNFALSAIPVAFIGVGMLVLLGTFTVAAQASQGSFATLGGTALLLFRALTYGQQLSGIQQRLGRVVPYAEALNDFILEARANAARHSSGTVRLDTIDTVQFVDTAYSYDVDLAPAIKDVNFELQRPALIAVVGPSGTGKTTVAHLALGLLQPTEGEVRINGTPMKDIDGTDLAGSVALVPQEPVVLHASVMDNIRFYRDGIADDDVVEIAKAIGIHDTIMDLENGYDTQIGETTRGLSGGQRQRIAIARALAGRPSMIILDEPTSALDTESERWVMDALNEIGANALALVIAHRQETIDRCDGVLRMSDGQIGADDLHV